jgi:hypothetical protein
MWARRRRPRRARRTSPRRGGCRQGHRQKLQSSPAPGPTFVKNSWSHVAPCTRNKESRAHTRPPNRHASRGMCCHCMCSLLLGRQQPNCKVQPAGRRHEAGPGHPYAPQLRWIKLARHAGANILARVLSAAGERSVPPGGAAGSRLRLRKDPSPPLPPFFSVGPNSKISPHPSLLRPPKVPQKTTATQLPQRC